MGLNHHRIVVFLLALLLMGVQQGALRHGLDHVQAMLREGQSQSADEAGLATDSLCEVCAAYAAVGATLPAPDSSPLTMVGRPLLGQVLPGFLHSTLSLAYRARAPPRCA